MQEYKTKTLDETKVEISALPCKVFGYYIQNPNSYDVFLKIYDKLSANVTIGTTDTDYTLQIPANGFVYIPYSNLPIYWLSVGLTIAATKLYLDSDTTALVTNLIFTCKYE